MYFIVLCVWGLSISATAADNWFSRCVIIALSASKTKDFFSTSSVAVAPRPI